MPGTFTVGTNIFSTYDSGFLPGTGTVHHEDLVDVVTILDSFQTPFFSSAPKTRARDVVHSWTIDTLAATSTAGVPEGADFSGDALTGPTRLLNYCQIFRRDVQVSDAERDANPAGIRDMYEHQVMKEFKVIARNYEARVFAMGPASASASAGVEATTAASGSVRMQGLMGQAAASAAGLWSISTAVSASGGVVTADLVTLAQTLFSNGAEPDSIWFAPDSKRQFVNATITSGTGVVNYRNVAADDRRLVANVDVWESPFNQLLVVITDRFIPCTTSSAVGAYYIGDRAMAKIPFFRPPQHKPMGKGGDHTRGIVLFQATLQLDHPSSWAAMTGVTNG